ncbi:MAG TPA: glycosyltransferase family 39 protein, partial [Chloroflexota bacterium]|nr:glycosyltransferase family 39 protein [Chloroflexota bacterium]
MATITADALTTAAPPKARHNMRAWHLGAALALLLAAAFLRLYKLDSLPPGMFIDVATNGLDIRNVLTLHQFPVFFPRNYGREALFIYFQAFLVAGAGMHPVVFTWSAVAMGMLTIALSYRLFDAMFGRWPALFGAALLAFSLWYVDLSRFGLRTNSLPPLLVATLYFLWRT